MQTTIEILGRNVLVTLSKRAQLALSKRSKPLTAEMELYFSCLIRMKVRFHDATQNSRTVSISDNLNIAFRPVMTSACSLDAVGDAAPPLTDFPIQKPDAFVPHWLKIDFHNDQWQGEFGYH